MYWLLSSTEPAGRGWRRRRRVALELEVTHYNWHCSHVVDLCSTAAQYPGSGSRFPSTYLGLWLPRTPQSVGIEIDAFAEQFSKGRDDVIPKLRMTDLNFRRNRLEHSVVENWEIKEHAGLMGERREGRSLISNIAYESSLCTSVKEAAGKLDFRVI